LLAKKLGFVHPVTKQKIELEIGLPDDFQKLIDIIQAEG